mmetsp:Transcript_35201/g.56583  ORF Transcript_35201/g.56583 Transcript_35201/m.56583 type:complete len:643 (+) Transcript_35201:577-2505(+)
MEKIFAGKNLDHWKDQISIMQNIAKIASKNPEALLPYIKKIISRVGSWVESLRSQVAGDAINCFAEMFKGLKTKMVVNKTYIVLLRRAAVSDKGFLASQAEKALRLALQLVSSRRIILLLIRHSNASSKGSQYRAIVTQMINEGLVILLEKMSNQWPLSSKDTTELLKMVSELSFDGSLMVRTHVKSILKTMDSKIGREKILQYSLRAHPSVDLHMRFVRQYNKMIGISASTASTVASTTDNNVTTPKCRKKDTPRPSSRRSSRLAELASPRRPSSRGGIAIRSLTRSNTKSTPRRSSTRLREAKKSSTEAASSSSSGSNGVESKAWITGGLRDSLGSARRGSINNKGLCSSSSSTTAAAPAANMPPPARRSSANNGRSSNGSSSSTTTGMPPPSPRGRDLSRTRRSSSRRKASTPRRATITQMMKRRPLSASPSVSKMTLPKNWKPGPHKAITRSRSRTPTAATASRSSRNRSSSVRRTQTPRHSRKRSSSVKRPASSQKASRVQARRSISAANNTERISSKMPFAKKLKRSNCSRRRDNWICAEQLEDNTTSMHLSSGQVALKSENQQTKDSDPCRFRDKNNTTNVQCQEGELSIKLLDKMMEEQENVTPQWPKNHSEYYHYLDREKANKLLSNVKHLFA